LFKDDQNVLWIGTKKGLFCNKNGVFVQFKEKEITSAVTYIMQDSKRKIWFCSEDGLGVIENENLKLYTARDGLSQNKTRHIYGHTDGVFCVATYGGGINRLKDDVFFSYDQNKEIIDAATSCIVEDDNDNFWISSNH